MDVNDHEVCEDLIQAQDAYIKSLITVHNGYRRLMQAAVEELEAKIAFIKAERALANYIRQGGL